MNRGISEESTRLVLVMYVCVCVGRQAGRQAGRQGEREGGREGGLRQYKSGIMKVLPLSYISGVIYFKDVPTLVS